MDPGGGERTDSTWRVRPAPVASSSGRAAERAAQILDDVMLRAGTEGGRGFTLGRAIVCAVFLAREVFFNSDELARGDPQTLLDVATLGGAVAISIVMYLVIPRVQATRRSAWLTRLFGTVVDAALFFVVIYATVRWPVPQYGGVIERPYIHFIGLVVCASALRFDKAFVLIAAALNLVSFAVLVLLDHMWWAPQLRYGNAGIMFDVMVIFSGAVVGLLFCDRARALALRGARRAIDAAKAREKLGAYLGKEVAEEALAVDDLVLGGRRQPVAVLFSDLRGFTTTAEHLAPEELVAQLNAYFEDMVRVIVDEGGVVDKYLGDSIMAVFGAPKSKPDDALRAIAAARRMQVALVKHNRGRAFRGLPPLAHGVGAHYGAVVAGNIGTHDHAQYTIVGDVVNVASRLESMTKEHGVPVLLSRELVDAARATGAVDDVTPFGALPVRGRQQPLEVFTLAVPPPAADGRG